MFLAHDSLHWSQVGSSALYGLVHTTQLIFIWLTALLLGNGSLSDRTRREDEVTGIHTEANLAVNMVIGHDFKRNS
jgi:hypothetical protein